MATSSLTFDLIAKDRASRAFTDVGRAADSSASKTAKFGALLGKAGLAFGAATAAAGIFTFKVGSSYVASLNQIQALTGASNKQMNAAAKQLEANAGLYAKMGQTTGDAAAGMVELTKSGLSLNQALGAIYGTMTLAKAGELAVADASSITANALNTFKLKAKQAGDVANYLANAANISSADVADIAESFKYVAPVAASAGVSIQQVNAVLAELANAGIKGSSAGTALRTFLLNLESPAASAEKVLHSMNIEVFDASGKMNSFSNIVGQLSKGFGGLNDATRKNDMRLLFGKTGIAGATTILNNGVKGLREYTKGVERAGAASKLAESRSKGLAGTFSTLRADVISAAQSVYRQFSPLADRVLRPLVKRFGDFAAHLGPNIQKGLDKVHHVFEKFNISGIGKDLAQQAQAWAAPVISGFEVGLNTGDWSGLGKALGNGIVKAAGALGDLSGKLGSVLGKIDWVGIGIDVGKQAPSFFVGVAAGLLNFDLLGLLKGVVRHWQDVLFAAIALWLTPVKIVGKVAEALARIPLVGKFLAWGLTAMKGFVDRMAPAVGKAFAFIGRAFLAGVRRVFPEVGKAFSLELRLFPTRIGVMAIEAAGKARKMVAGVASAIARGTGAVAAKIGELIARMIRPFANAGSWLVSKGVALIGGLLKGVTSKIGDALAPLRTLGSKAVAAVGNLGSALYNAGASLISGFISGIASKIGSVKSTLGGLTSKLTSWKGPPEKDRRLLRPAGQMLMDGLVKGITDRQMKVRDALSKVTDLISKVGDQIKNLMSIKSGFLGTFTPDNLFATDLSEGGNISTIIAAQQAQMTQAKQFAADVKQVIGLGLSKSLVRQLESEGTSGAAALHMLATSGKGTIQQLNTLNKQTSDSLQAAGLRAGNYVRGGSINDDIRRARRQDHVLELLEHHLKDLAKSEKKGETIIVKIGDDAIIKAIHRYEQRKGKKATSA